MTQPHPHRCETCLNYESSGQWCIFLHERIANIEYTLIERVGCASHTSSTHTPAAPATFPNSAELIQMAEMEWHNREERFGLHDKISWTTGWMAGFLTPNKPGLCEMNLEVDTRATILRKVEFDEWLKERDAAIRKAERDQVLDAYAAWDNTHWTTQRVKEYKESLRGGA